MRSDVTVLIATIPGREHMLAEAMASVMEQSYPCLIMISPDKYGHGATETRNRALSAIRTKYTAFLDDDDLLLPGHISTLAREANTLEADVVYSGCRVVGANYAEIDMGQSWNRFGEKFDPDILRQRNYIPVTALVRTKLARESGGFKDMSEKTGADPCEDWGLWLNMLRAGATFTHIPLITWVYRRMGQNTGGRGRVA